MRLELLKLRWRIKLRYANAMRAIREWLSSISLIVEWGLPFGTGIALGQWDEFGPALVCFVIAALALVLRSSVWKGVRDKRKTTTALKGLGVAGSILFFLLCWLVAWTKKGDKPWSPTWDQYFTVASISIPNRQYLVPSVGYEKTKGWDAGQHVVDRTEVASQFAGREELQIALADITGVTAATPKSWFAMIDATNCFVWPGKPDDCQPLPLTTQTYSGDYINGKNRIGPFEVLWQSPAQVAKQHVKSHDVIVGLIGSTCFNCVRARRYYVYFKFNEGGWFYPIPMDSHILIPTVI